MSITFTDNSVKVKAVLEEALVSGLCEAAGLIQGQAKENSRVRTGQLKNSWDYVVDENKLEATIGSPLENAIWEEFGTGEYCLHGDGRKGGWTYVDDEGKGHFTHGKNPMRTLQNAFNTKKNSAIKAIQDKVKQGVK